MSNRHQRRSDLAVLKSSGALWTFLCEPDDARLRSAPLLQQTVNEWLNLLTKRVRNCIICSSGW